MRVLAAVSSSQSFLMNPKLDFQKTTIFLASIFCWQLINTKNMSQNYLPQKKSIQKLDIHVTATEDCPSDAVGRERHPVKCHSYSYTIYEYSGWL